MNRDHATARAIALAVLAARGEVTEADIARECGQKPGPAFSAGVKAAMVEGETIASLLAPAPLPAVGKAHTMFPIRRKA